MTREKRLYIETSGCQMNVSDSEKIAARLREIGYQATTEQQDADLIILNTCSVRAKAEEKVYIQLQNLWGRKKRNRRLLLGVGGCVAQQEGERLLAKVPYLDFVFGTHALHQLPQLVLAAEQGERTVDVGVMDQDERRDLFPGDVTEGGISRFVTVMQGCDNFCSYCIVPYVRGREMSRRAADVLDEIGRLVAQGAREVTLLGQNVNSYGLKSAGEPDFAGLLTMVAAVPGIERIRFMTSHPKDISSALIDCFAVNPKLCSHIHLPAQSGCDRVLAAMNRGYTRAEYLDKVAALKAARPDIQITSDMIVGFPGETESEFQETLSLMAEVQYADLFSFSYSPRPETAAAKFADQVSRAVRQERLERLQALQRDYTRARNRSFVGTRQELLVEGVSKRGDQLFGRTSGNRIVNFAGPAGLIGRLATVTITEDYQNSLLGELV